MKQFGEWKSDFLSRLSNKKRLTSIEKIILTLAFDAQLPKMKQTALERLLRTEYKKQIAESNLSKEKKLAAEKQHELLKQLRALERTQSKISRQKRAHELITIGALTELLTFPKDRGTVCGALDFVLAKIKSDKDFEHQIKQRGDAILKQREEEKQAVLK